MDPREIGWVAMDLGEGPLEGCCEHGNEPSEPSGSV
jgi:hypothetical protein